MNKIIRIMLCCVAALTLATLAAAQDAAFGEPHAVQLPRNVVLPSAPVFTNCGVGCTNFSTKSAYSISGTGVASSDNPGQTIAAQFKPKATVTFTKALAADFCCFAGSTVNAVAYLMTDVHGLPGKTLARMVSKGCPGASGNAKPCKFKPPTGKKITLKKGVHYWLCEQAPSKTISYGWILSLKDASTAKNFAANAAGACVTSTWALVPSGVVRPAFEIN